MVVVINGMPTVGKSQFVEECLGSTDYFSIAEHSTVDFVKYIAKECGWDGTKTPTNRKFLSDLKDLLTQWGDVPFQKSIEYIRWHDNITKEMAERMLPYRRLPTHALTFIHCREPKEIQKYVDYYGKDECKTLLIRRAAVETNNQSNHADAEVFNYQYDYTIFNDGTLEELQDKARKFLSQLWEEENDRSNSNNSGL